MRMDRTKRNPQESLTAFTGTCSGENASMAAPVAPLAKSYAADCSSYGNEATFEAPGLNFPDQRLKLVPPLQTYGALPQDMVTDPFEWSSGSFQMGLPSA
eukprot:SAG31_NODE_6673_length_1931_cov_1.334061_2_plen_100_part_00